MDKDMQNRLNLLFEMESIKTNLMNYISPDVTIRVITDLGFKDKNGAKRKFYEEIRYPSKKYNNTDNLISSVFHLNTYLILDYPNVRYNEFGGMKKNGIIIRGFALDEMVAAMKNLNDNLHKSYRLGSDGKIILLSDKVMEVTVRPTITSKIVFSTDIYHNNSLDKDEPGIQMTFNDEYSTIISAETTWLEMIYRLSKCDLTMYGLQMVQSYMSLLPGMAVSTFGDNEYSATSRFAPYWEDPDDIVNMPESIKVAKKKPDPFGRKKSFFDD